MKKKFKISAIVTVLALSGLLYVYYGFLYKPLRDVSGETAVAGATAQKLALDYAANTTATDAKYLNATIGVEGKVTEIRDSLIVLDQKVVCMFDNKPAGVAINRHITIKGRCIGYDELFEEVKLDQCIIQ